MNTYKYSFLIKGLNITIFRLYIRFCIPFKLFTLHLYNEIEDYRKILNMKNLEK